MEEATGGCALLRLALLLLLVSQASAGEKAAYEIGVRDVISVEVYGEPDLSNDYEVSATGTITAPLLGRLPIEGLSPEEVEALLTQKYRDGLLNNPEISVRVSEHRSQRVEVYGAVEKPGPYYLDGPATLLEMLGRAGWIDEKKSSRSVTLRRKSGQIVALSLTAVMSGDANPGMVAGDVVSVDEGQLVYVGGEVEESGPVVYTDGLTVMQALLLAGGPSAYARLRNAYIVRDGKKIPVNLRRIREGREADVSLYPGDQLFVRESPI